MTMRGELSLYENRSGMSGMDFRNVIFMFLCIALSVLIYYPFFKVYEKQAVEKETKEAEEEDDFEW